MRAAQILFAVIALLGALLAGCLSAWSWGTDNAPWYIRAVAPGFGLVLAALFIKLMPAMRRETGN